MSCSLFSSRDGAYTGYYLPLTVHLRPDPSIAGAQLAYQDACGQRQSLSIAAPLQELLKRKIGRVFEEVLTGETGSSSPTNGAVDTVLGLAQVDLAIHRKATKRYPATVTLGLDFAYKTLDGAVLYSKKIQSIGRGEVEVTEVSCEVKGLEAIAHEAMDLVTDGMAVQLGTSTKIHEAAQARKADESQAVSLPSLATAPVSIPLDQPATVIFRAILRHENRDQALHSGEAVVIEVEVKNEGPGIARAVELLVTAMPTSIERIPSVVSVGDLQPGEVKHLALDGKIGKATDVVQEELTLILRAGSPSVQLPSAKKFLMMMTPGSMVEAVVQSVDIDQPPRGTSLLKQPKAIGIVVGVGQFRESSIPRLKYAARDAEAMATYLTSIGGIPAKRIRTLVDSHALKGDLAEVLEEWLPEQVDPTTVVYVSVMGRGVVEPTTGAVSMMLFDSTATSRARLYSLRRLQESLAKLPIQRAVVMLDLSLEPAQRTEATGTITPLWEQEGSGKENIMWIIGNRAVQKSHDYDQGRHGLFAYQLLKGLSGAADLDKNGTILAGELCTYTKWQVLKMAREQFGQEQEPLCLPGPGQEALVRLQPVARLR
ncbi:MAG: caspase family protein [Nitrospirota bacterium]